MVRKLILYIMLLVMAGVGSGVIAIPFVEQFIPKSTGVALGIYDGALAFPHYLVRRYFDVSVYRYAVLKDGYFLGFVIGILLLVVIILEGISIKPIWKWVTENRKAGRE